jgi:hypothetical protein
MKAVGIAVALGCMFVGWWTASLSNPSQKIPGLVLVGYGFAILALALLGKNAVLKWFLVGPAVLLIVLYSLPMSFWQWVGLAKGPDGG